jgi:GDP-D-mannose dehydratase
MRETSQQNNNNAMTNLEKVKRFMETAPLGEIFTLLAMSKFVEESLEDPENIKEKLPSYIDSDAWLETAKAWQKMAF